MSIAIEEVTIGTTDKRLVLGNAAVARVMSIGSSWNKIRIGARLAFDDTGANLGGTPQLYFGVMSNPDATLSNGPLGAATSHFLGYNTVVATWGRNTANTRYGYTAGTLWGCKKIGAAKTQAGNSFGVPQWSATPSIRTGFILEIIKGSPNFTLNVLGRVTNVSDTDLQWMEEALVTPTFLDAEAILQSDAATYSPGTAALPVDEGVNGALNAICIAWDKTTSLCHISEVLYAKLS